MARRRIGFDATPLLDLRTGVGEFVAQVLDRLGRRADLDVVGFGFTRAYLPQLTAALPPGVRPTERPIPARTTRWAWLRADRPTIERWTGPLDVVHGPNFVVPPSAGASELVTVHDLTCVHFPDLCDSNTVQYPTLIRRAVRRGAHVHTVSDFVAEEVRAAFAIGPERVHVIPNGLTPGPPGDAHRGRTLAGAERYLLFIGTLEPRKNVPGLIEAFELVADGEPDLDLVLAGRDGWGSDAVTSTLASSRHRRRIHRVGYVDDGSRADLLAGAAALVYPSRYEGFGLPPLEAMSRGTPVIATRAGAVPEVVADAARLVDVDDVADLAAGIEDVLHDQQATAAMVRRGQVRATQFDWDRTTDELVALYRALGRDR